MPASRLAGALTTLLCCVSLAAVAGDPLAESKAPQAATPQFKPPPGFRAKKRGELVIYCRKEAVMGSRFPAEKCYDEAGIRELKRAELEKTEILERIRACTTGFCQTG